MAAESNRWRLFVAGGVVAAAVLVGLALPAGQNLLAQFLRLLRMQNVQAVNVDLSAFTDPNANPTLHQMVAQMISDKVTVTVNESGSTAGRRRGGRARGRIPHGTSRRPHGHAENGGGRSSTR